MYNAYRGLLVQGVNIAWSTIMWNVLHVAWSKIVLSNHHWPNLFCFVISCLHFILARLYIVPERGETRFSTSATEHTIHPVTKDTTLSFHPGYINVATERVSPDGGASWGWKDASENFEQERLWEWPQKGSRKDGEQRAKFAWEEVFLKSNPTSGARRAGFLSIVTGAPLYSLHTCF